jgi:hypothetical protein
MWYVVCGTTESSLVFRLNTSFPIENSHPLRVYRLCNRCDSETAWESRYLELETRCRFKAHRQPTLIRIEDTCARVVPERVGGFATLGSDWEMIGVRIPHSKLGGLPFRRAMPISCRTKRHRKPPWRGRNGCPGQSRHALSSESQIVKAFHHFVVGFAVTSSQWFSSHWNCR